MSTKQQKPAEEQQAKKPRSEESEKQKAKKQQESNEAEEAEVEKEPQMFGKKQYSDIWELFKECIYKDMEEEGGKELPLNVESFTELFSPAKGQGESCSFVDKTMMLQGVLGEQGMKSIYVTGPQMFGKSFNLSMFRTFMDGYCAGNERKRKQNKRLYDGMNISEVPEFCQAHQQKYFVIHLDFSILDGVRDMAEVKARLSVMMYFAYFKFTELCQTSSFIDTYGSLWDSISDPIDEEYLPDSLSKLAKYINEAIGKEEDKEAPTRIALLVDHFDAPYTSIINQSKSFYDSFVTFMDQFLCSVEGETFAFVFFTGVRRIPFPPGSHCANSLRTLSIFEKPLHQWYGFTNRDVDTLLEQAGLVKYKDGFEERGGGYLVPGGEEEGAAYVYNPLFVVYVIRDSKFQNHWRKCGRNSSVLLDGFGDDESKQRFGARLSELLTQGRIDLSGFDLSDPPMLPTDRCFDEREAWMILLQKGYIQLKNIKGLPSAVMPNFGVFHVLQRDVVDQFRSPVDEKAVAESAQ